MIYCTTFGGDPRNPSSTPYSLAVVRCSVSSSSGIAIRRTDRRNKVIYSGQAVDQRQPSRLFLLNFFGGNQSIHRSTTEKTRGEMFNVVSDFDYANWPMFQSISRKDFNGF